MVKLKKGLLVITLVSLIMLSIRPFSIYADSISTSNITGLSYEVLSNDVEYVGSSYQQRYIYRLNVYLDNFYKGSITLKINTTVAGTTTSSNYSTYVYGNVAYFTMNFILRSGDNYSSGPLSYVYVESVTSSNVEIISNTNNLQFSFPTESLNVQTFAFNNLDYIGLSSQYEYYYGVFNVHQNEEIYRSYGVQDREYWFYFVMDKNMYNYDIVANYLEFNNCTLLTYNFLTRYFINGNLSYLFKFGIKVSTTNQFYIKYTAANNAYYMPIYFNEKTYPYISTDFALRYGLSNKLLDDLDIIAQGTQASNDSSSDLESSTSSFSSTASDVYNVEDQVSSGFSSSMQNIPSSFNFENNFGSSFVVSASWVRDQFNNMTANNPFGSLITFSLILGVALLIIGRLLS